MVVSSLFNTSLNPDFRKEQLFISCGGPHNSKKMRDNAREYRGFSVVLVFFQTKREDNKAIQAIVRRYANPGSRSFLTSHAIAHSLPLAQAHGHFYDVKVDTWSVTTYRCGKAHQSKQRIPFGETVTHLLDLSL